MTATMETRSVKGRYDLLGKVGGKGKILSSARRLLRPQSMYVSCAKRRREKRVITIGVVAQSPFRSLKRIFDHSKVRFTANLKLALWAQTLSRQGSLAYLAG